MLWSRLLWDDVGTCLVIYHTCILEGLLFFKNKLVFRWNYKEEWRFLLAFKLFLNDFFPMHFRLSLSEEVKQQGNFILNLGQEWRG